MAMPAAADEQELEALYTQVLAVRMREPRRVAELAGALAARAGGDRRWSARARVLQAQGRYYLGEREAWVGDLTQALTGFEGLDDARGLALARDLMAGYHINRGDYESAHALLQSVWALAPAQRTPLEWCISAGRMTSLLERRGDYDDALRWHYRAIAYAREVGDAAYLANALGGAGGLQISLNNLEDAAALCEPAWRLVCEHDLGGGLTYALVATNWMMTLHFLDRDDEALALAEELDAASPMLVDSNAAKRELLTAMVFSRARRSAHAQALLDIALARYGPLHAPPIEWSVTRARLHNLAGHPAEALAVCRAAEEAHRLGLLRDTPLPADLALLHTEAVQAHEALGDPAGALRAHRALLAVEREKLGMGTRARRLTLQIQFEFDEMQREGERLRTHNAALAEADAAKSRFLAAASHDLRQPIHALGLQLAHLRASLALQPGDDEGRATVERMERTLGALTAMFDTLLDISRMDAGVLAPRRGSVALQPLLGRLAEEFAPQARAKGLRLALRVPPRAATDSDPVLLESLVRNLLSNAVKYTERGGVLLALRPRGANWLLQVWDSGPGIAEAERERVFEEFHQLDNAARDRARGLGLGLAIVRRLCRLLGHRLALDSRVGHGSCFALELARSAAPVPPSTHDAPEQTTAALRVAVIEDDDEVRDSVAALLRRWGHEVVAGEDADAVLACAGTAAVDAVIADYRLRDPQQPGDAQARRVQAALGPEAPVLIVSGDTAPERLRALAASGLAWLSKPVQAARLRSWLASVAPRA